MNIIEQSIETKNLLNPAFCGLVYASIVEGYNLKSTSSIPFYLPYFLMPIVLHKESRLQIPRTSVSKFHLWIQDTEQIKIGLPERAKNLKPYVSNASMFLHGQGYIKTDANLGVKIVNSKQIKSHINKSQSIENYTRKAKTLGAICGKHNNNLSILVFLGVQV